MPNVRILNVVHHIRTQMSARYMGAMKMNAVVISIHYDLLRTVMVVVMWRRFTMYMDVLVVTIYHNGAGVVVMVMMRHRCTAYVDMVVVPLHYNSVGVVVEVVVVNVDMIVGTLDEDTFGLGDQLVHLTRRNDQGKGSTVDVDVIVVALHDYLVRAVVVMVMMAFVQTRWESLELHVADRDTAADPKAFHTGNGVNGIHFALQRTPLRREHGIRFRESTHRLFRMLLL